MSPLFAAARKPSLPSLVGLVSTTSTSLADAASQQTDVSSAIAEGSVEDTMEQIGTFNVVKEFAHVYLLFPLLILS